MYVGAYVKGLYKYSKHIMTWLHTLENDLTSPIIFKPGGHYYTKNHIKMGHLKVYICLVTI
jgi:hypothetical protein